MFITVDNPRDGNCAFYAYAIAFIDMIKHENSRNITRTFETWCAYDPSIITTCLSVENKSTKNYHRFCTDRLLIKQEIQNIYKTYPTDFIAFFGKNHMTKGKEIVQMYDNPQMTGDQIIAVITQYINDSEIKFNSDSSFIMR